MTIVARIALASFVAICCSCRSERVSPTADSQVTVELGGSINVISGIYWPTGNVVETLTIEKPRTITVRFPSGRRWTSYSKITFLTQKEETVSQVEVAPLKDATDFAAALTKLQAILDEIGVAADSPARERLKDWQAEPVDHDPFAQKSLAADVEEGVEMLAEIKPTSEEDKWFLLCTFYAKRLFETPPLD
jgi:hypothetical protein